MLLRLLLALLVAGLSLPAMASTSCHAPAAAASTHHGMPAKQPAPATAALEMACIGCVAPATLRAPVVTAPAGFAPVLAPRAVPPGLPLAATPPATPPPRSGA